jgi:hypothetical protein
MTGLIGAGIEKNPATNYQSGQEFDVDWSAGHDMNRAGPLM